MNKRTVALLVLVPLGAALGFGLFRMIQHDWTAQAPPPKEEPTRVERPARPETERPQGPSAGAVAQQMRQLYQQGANKLPTGKELAEFSKLAATLELRHLLALLDEWETEQPPARARDEFLLPLYARWAGLEPLRAWEKVRDEGYAAKEAPDRTWAVRRMAAILETWSRTDAAMALAAYLEVERGAEALRHLAEWQPALQTLFANACKALGEKYPERLRGMASHRDHALALGQWAAAQWAAGQDPAALGKRIDDEAVEAMQGAGNDEERLQGFRTDADHVLAKPWFERDQEAAMTWFAERHGAAGVVDFLATYPDRLDPASLAGRRERVRQFLLARPEEARDQWIASWLEKTRGDDLAMLACLGSDELRFALLRRAAWPKVNEPNPEFEPWACDPADVRRVMDEIQLDETRRTEIEEILSVR